MYAYRVYLIFNLGISPLNFKTKYTHNFEIKKFAVSSNNVLEKNRWTFLFSVISGNIIQSQIQGVYVWVCIHILYISSYVHTNIFK